VENVREKRDERQLRRFARRHDGHEVDVFPGKDDFDCHTNLEDLSSLSIQVATIFAGIAVATSLLTIMCLMFMVFLKSTTVFHLCGWMQILSGKDCTFAPRIRNRATSEQVPATRQSRPTLS